MRLVGPNCFGVAVPGSALDATFGARHPAPGQAGLVVQSGGIGIALLEQLSRLGIGVSSFASVGDKYDVSSNDMLTWWEQDGTTRLAMLYVESFGNPRKFARTARRVGRTMPVLTVVRRPVRRRPAGRRVAHRGRGHARWSPRRPCSSRPGSSPPDSLGELTRRRRAAGQPAAAGRPTGWRSCPTRAAPGCWPRTPARDVRPACHRLTGDDTPAADALLPRSGPVTGPVDTTATVAADPFRGCLEVTAADDGVDAVLALSCQPPHRRPAARHPAADVPVPLAAVVLDQAEGVEMLPRVLPAADGPDEARRRTGAVPCYAYPEAAATRWRARLGYGAWRARQAGRVIEFATWPRTTPGP